ncbi:MAG: DUF2784 family protein, partial [Gemmatimonadales bacterium]|nr:DUF2784 family protein [Gemmatimonadales bacterium]
MPGGSARSPRRSARSRRCRSRRGPAGWIARGSAGGQDSPPMLPRLLADLVLVLHLAFLVFVLAGGLLALRWRRVPWLHLPAAAWGIYT